MSRTEAQMIEPVRQLMFREMKLDVIVEEFSAGYGFADLVGAKLCSEGCQSRELMGMAVPLDHRHLVSVLLSLNVNNTMSISSLLEQVSIAESTLRYKVLPLLKRMKLVEQEPGGGIKLLTVLPKPTDGVIAIEAKQTRWREAILQARRYTFFAEQSYVAVWKETAARVDRLLLESHRIGLISVEPDGAEILIVAPRLTPREAEMNLFCSEFLYGHALNSGYLSSACF